MTPAQVTKIQRKHQETFELVEPVAGSGQFGEDTVFSRFEVAGSRRAECDAGVKQERRWYRYWQVWVCLGLALLWWLVTMPFRLLDWLLSIFR